MFGDSVSVNPIQFVLDDGASAFHSNIYPGQEHFCKRVGEAPACVAAHI